MSGKNHDMIEMLESPAVVLSIAPRLNRQVFKTSRLLEFCSQKELELQTGHPVEQWPLVVLKELIDNALDACEEAGIAPAIKVEVRGGSITVTDNGPGLASETVDSLLDFNVRVSSREAYVSPTRGAQGNALKTLVGHAVRTGWHFGRDLDRGQWGSAPDQIRGRWYPRATSLLETPPLSRGESKEGKVLVEDRCQKSDTPPPAL